MVTDLVTDWLPMLASGLAYRRISRLFLMLAAEADLFKLADHVRPIGADHKQGATIKRFT